MSPDRLPDDVPDSVPGGVSGGVPEGLRDSVPRVIEINGVVRRFESAAGPVVALDGVDLIVENGSFTVVAGPSGSGKSTLLGLAACIDRPDAGSVLVGGRDVLALGRRARSHHRRVGTIRRVGRAACSCHSPTGPATRRSRRDGW